MSPRPPMDDGADEPRESLRDRVRDAILRPASTESPEPVSPEANDKERLVGLVAAPLAAAIGFAITSSLIANDPAARLTSGAANPLHVGVSRYHEALLALLVLAGVMLVTAMLRKRLFLGMAMVLYGLTVFNLRFWGFAFPFLAGGSWLLVRAYRAHRAATEAGGGEPSAR